MRNGSRFYCQTAPIGFNLYDNEEKLRLKITYQTREEAESVSGSTWCGFKASFRNGNP